LDQTPNKLKHGWLQEHIDPERGQFPLGLEDLLYDDVIEGGTTGEHHLIQVECCTSEVTAAGQWLELEYN